MIWELEKAILSDHVATTLTKKTQVEVSQAKKDLGVAHGHSGGLEVPGHFRNPLQRQQIEVSQNHKSGKPHCQS